MGKSKEPTCNRPIRLVLLVFLLTPFLIPTSVTNGYISGYLEFTYKVWKLISIIAICYFVIAKQYRFDGRFVTLFGFFLVASISTIVNDGLVSQQVNLSISWLACFVLVSLFMRDQVDDCLDALTLIFASLLIVNLVTLIVFPNAMFLSETGMKNWFLGDRNVFVAYLIPAVCSSLLRDYRREKLISPLSWFIWLAGAIELFLVWSATSLVVYALMSMGLMLVLVMKARPKFLCFEALVLMVAVVFLAIVVFRLQDYLAFFITQILGKDLTLTGRTFIWDEAISIISQHMLFGQGMQEVITLIPVWDGTFSVSHAHDVYLQVLCVSGFTGFVLIASFMVVSSRFIRSNPKAISSLIVSVCVGSALLGLCFDYYHATAFCVLLSLLANCGCIEMEDRVLSEG